MFLVTFECTTPLEGENYQQYKTDICGTTIAAFQDLNAVLQIHWKKVNLHIGLP
jgi:hypothetical protein